MTDRDRFPLPLRHDAAAAAAAAARRGAFTAPGRCSCSDAPGDARSRACPEQSGGERGALTEGPGRCLQVFPADRERAESSSPPD